MHINNSRALSQNASITQHRLVIEDMAANSKIRESIVEVDRFTNYTIVWRHIDIQLHKKCGGSLLHKLVSLYMP